MVFLQKKQKTYCTFEIQQYKIILQRFVIILVQNRWRYLYLSVSIKLCLLWVGSRKLHSMTPMTPTPLMLACKRQGCNRFNPEWLHTLCTQTHHHFILSDNRDIFFCYESVRTTVRRGFLIYLKLRSLLTFPSYLIKYLSQLNTWGLTFLVLEVSYNSLL